MDKLLLIVEDEPVLRASLVRGLAKLDDITVVGAGTLSEARALLDDEIPHLIISDIDLPDGTGVELLSDLEERAPTTPIVFASAYTAKYRAHIPERSTITVLEKPVPLATFRELVSDCIGSDSREQRREAPFSVADYIQLACMSRKSVEIVVERSGATMGRIQINKGELWSAHQGHHQGAEALRRVLFVEGLKIRVGNPQSLRERNIHQGWEAVLMDSARLHDEGESEGLDEAFEEELDWELPEGAVPMEDEAVTVEAATQRRVELNYEKQERKLSAYAASTDESGSRPRSNSARLRFDELIDAGVDALLRRDYSAALGLFAEAHELVPSDPSVVANLKRLEELGYVQERA